MISTPLNRLRLDDGDGGDDDRSPLPPPPLLSSSKLRSITTYKECVLCYVRVQYALAANQNLLVDHVVWF